MPDTFVGLLGSEQTQKYIYLLVFEKWKVNLMPIQNLRTVNS